jgi:hypothetical protein
VSERNLEFLRERGGRYLARTPRRQLRKFEEALPEKEWRAGCWSAASTRKGTDS